MFLEKVVWGVEEEEEDIFDMIIFVGMQSHYSTHLLWTGLERDASRFVIIKK